MLGRRWLMLFYGTSIVSALAALTGMAVGGLTSSPRLWISYGMNNRFWYATPGAFAVMLPMSLFGYARAHDHGPPELKSWYEACTVARGRAAMAVMRSALTMSIERSCSRWNRTTLAARWFGLTT
jgi:hypothetical protein